MPPKKKIETVQEEKAEGTPVKKARNGKAKAKPEEAEGQEVAASPVLTKKEKAAISAEKNGAHIRDIVTPKVLESDHKFLKIISWNVNGFKALVANNLHILTNLIANHKPDILCLQETKLQTSQVNEFRHILEGYESHWSCSTVKNGYSGTAVFINKSTVDTKSVNGTTATGDGAAAAAPPSKKKQATMSAFFKKTTVSGGTTVEETSSAAAAAAVTVAAAAASTSATASPVVQLQRISYDFEDEKKSFSGEGRTITLEFNNFFLVACYVPNSGEGLVRLDYRTKQWDPWVREYLTRLHQRKPVVYTGDLNVGYLDLDIHNPTAKHIDKQAGLTPQERQSHGELLSTTGFKDAFRYFYPDARGQFTYWSQRTFARPVNRGIRLDYFLCSGDMFKTSTAAADSKATEVEEEEVKNGVNLPARRVEVSLQDTPSPGVYDSYQLPEDTKGCSDHGPVVLVVKV